jgi:hypothetical protein
VHSVQTVHNLSSGVRCAPDRGSPPPNNEAQQPKSGCLAGTSGRQKYVDHSLPRPVCFSINRPV